MSSYSQSTPTFSPINSRPASANKLHDKQQQQQQAVAAPHQNNQPNAPPMGINNSFSANNVPGNPSEENFIKNNDSFIEGNNYPIQNQAPIINQTGTINLLTDGVAVSAAATDVASANNSPQLLDELE